MLRVTKFLVVFAIACGGQPTPNPVVVPSARGPAFTVQLPAATFLDDLDDRERREQMRDWGVLATLSHEGATPEQTAAATYQLPAARLPYLDELYTFTYGRGRRAYFGERVLLFVDADDPDRVATVGRLADQVKMELGEVPANAEIYVVEDQRNDGTLQITHDANVEGARLFSADYGYVQAEVANEPQLAAWLSNVDDVTRIRIEPGKLVLGGRRFARTRTAGVTVDDIAALYQAQAKAHDREADPKRQLEELEAKYKEEYKRRLGAEGIFEGARYSKAGLERIIRIRDRIRAEVEAEAMAAGKRLMAEVARTTGNRDPGFSLDPHWLPAADAKHPLMLTRLQQLAEDPCTEIRRIANLAPKLLAAEPDETRRSGEAWAASEFTTTKIAVPTCVWLRTFVGNRLAPVTAALDSASPEAWRDGFAPVAQLRQDLVAALPGLTELQRDALINVLAALSYYAFETGAQCARYDGGIEGTAVGMTLFYTDLLAKLWESVDYGHSAPLHAVPGFLTSPRVDVAPAFAEELKRLPGTRIWFAPRKDGWTRTGAGPTSELAFVHRFSRVYAAGSDPAHPGKESTANEASRLSIGWWDRHFDEIADHEQQYHRQNQIMKWSAATAAMLETFGAPIFLASVQVDRSAKLFPWLAAHRDQLRFQEPVPERRSPDGTECIALLHSYPFRTAGRSGRYIHGGVSLAGREVVETAPTLNRVLPPGQRLVTIADDAVLPRRALKGPVVSIENAEAARARTSAGPMNLHGLETHFEGGAGTPAIRLKTGAGDLTRITFGRTDSGIKIEVHGGPVEDVRAALGRPERDAGIAFEGRPERVVRTGDTLVEVKPSAGPPDDSVTAVAHDRFGPGWRQARAADASEVHKRMDGYEWAVVEPRADAARPPTVRFGSTPPPSGVPARPPTVRFVNTPPPSGAPTVEVRGLRGITTARTTAKGEVYFPRPADPRARADWYGLSDRVNARPGGIPRGPGRAGPIDLSEPEAAGLERQIADQIARSGRLEEAAVQFASAIPKQPLTLEDRARVALRDIGQRNPRAARRELEALTARGHEVTADTRTLLVDSLRGHGTGDVAKFVDAKLAGKSMPEGMSLVEDRGRLTVQYEARQIAKVKAVDTTADTIPPVVYFDHRLLVGPEGFEPDFSGPIARWRHDPTVTVYEMKAHPFGVNPGVIVETSTGMQYLRAHDHVAADFASTIPDDQRVYMIVGSGPSDDRRCDDDARKGHKRKAGEDCADGS